MKNFEVELKQLKQLNQLIEHNEQIIKLLKNFEKEVFERGEALSATENVFTKMFIDITLKSKSIFILISEESFLGVSSLARTILEGYMYLKYILEQEPLMEERAEAYKLNMEINELKFYESLLSGKKYGKMKDILKVGSIKPIYNEGHSEKDFLVRYCKLINYQFEEGKIDKWKIPNFYYNSEIKSDKLSKLFEYLGEEYLYYVCYSLFSREIHSNLNIDEIDKILIKLVLELCNEINFNISEVYLPKVFKLITE